MAKKLKESGEAKEYVLKMAKERDVRFILTEKSEVVRKALGDHVFDAFIKNKKIEWDQYRTQVTDYELKKYLPIL